jgi:hypothetical protein
MAPETKLTCSHNERLKGKSRWQGRVTEISRVYAKNTVIDGTKIAASKKA